ncbi:MAG: hypothetical protein GX597_11040 [Anaerolineaceae bacterium]|nr:hypothetical protein [Anaerolineaceae bacterium]
MKKRITLVAAAALLLSGLAVAMAGLETRAQAAQEWEYRWEVRDDGTSQVWRRPAGDADGGWMAAGTVPQEIVEITGSDLEPGVAIARTPQALFYTGDAGRQWQQMAGLPDWPTAVALGRERAGLIYLGTLTGGVYRSLDAGATWQPLPWDLDMMAGTFVEVTALAVHPQDDDIVYAAAGHWLGSTDQRFTPAGIAMSMDAGQSWEAFHRAGLDEARVIGLEPDAEEPLRVLVTTGQEGSQWLTMEGAALPGWSLSAGRPAESALAPVPAQQAERAGPQAALQGDLRETLGWLLVSLGAIAILGVSLRWAWLSQSCPPRCMGQ